MFVVGDVQGAARELGLEMRNDVASGLVDGRPISIAVEWTTRQLQVFVRARLAPPLDLGLRMQRRELAFLRSNDFSTGSDDLDTELAIDADEPARAAALFGGDLRRQLVNLHRAAYDFQIDDAGVALTQLYGFGADDGWIVRAAHAAVATATLLDEARAGLGPAGPLGDHARALRAFAGARRLGFSSAPLSVIGQLDGRLISLWSVRTGKAHHHLAAHAPFEADLGLGLAIRREGIFDAIRSMLGGQDIVVGDEPFDKRFLVRAAPARASRVGELLDGDARAALVALDTRAGPVAVDDRGITVEPILPGGRPPETGPWLLDTLDEARVRIDRNLVHGSVGGPYR